ncbi:hypothetical protein D9M73_212330 [compost metagenome]
MKRLERHEYPAEQQPGQVLHRERAEGIIGDAFLHDRTEGHTCQRQQAEEHPGQRHAGQADALIDHHDQTGQAQRQAEHSAG